jgi:hypothetical protein
MPRFQPGDYVKAEFQDETTGESERMWVVVDSCDNQEGVLVSPKYRCTASPCGSEAINVTICRIV